MRATKTVLLDGISALGSLLGQSASFAGVVGGSVTGHRLSTNACLMVRHLCETTRKTISD